MCSVFLFSQTEEPIISRTINGYVSQSLEIEYPGMGWIFLGNYDGDNEVIQFKTRKNQDETTLFTLILKKEGEYILHFYKQDLINNTFIEDYLKIIVAPFSGETSILKDSSYAKVIPSAVTIQNVIEETDKIKKENEAKERTDGIEKEITIEDIADVTLQDSDKVEELEITKKQAVIVESIPQEPKIQEIIDKTEKKSITEITNTEIKVEEDYLASGKKAFDEGLYEEAITKLNLFLESSVLNNDIALFLLGESYEAPGNSKNIRKALEMYQKVVSDYPQSSLWNKASERIIYIQRFYFTVR
jgi:tetratricopeptide (TPR) repeat protein